jgi:hypothetical protein
MRKTLVILGLLVLAALNWAALHDILKQNEPDYTAEWLVVVASAVILIATAIRFLRIRAQRSA